MLGERSALELAEILSYNILSGISEHAILTTPVRSDAEAAHVEREWLRGTLSSIGDAVITTDATGQVTLLNPMAQSLTGWTQDEAIGHPLEKVFTVVSEDSRLPVESPAIRALRADVGVVSKSHTLLVAKDGTERAIEDSAAPIRNSTGEVGGVVLVFRDVTDRRRAETSRRLEDSAWRKSEVQYRRLFESARDGILILDETTGKIIDANPYMSELLGYEHSHFLGKELWEIGLFRDITANQAAFRELQDNGYIRYDHLPLETREKKKVDVEFVSNCYEADGRQVLQCNIRDCSDRFRLEQAVKASLEEKEVLLREVHHRVKNNLQVISSLLHLQSEHTQDESSIRIFRKTQDRVRSMALVHERLYRSHDIALVDFTDYIENLAHHLFQSQQTDTDRIKLAVDVQGVRLPIDAAVPVGLLLNELISNCLKHAFVGLEAGHIRIKLRPFKAGELLLSVSDDGVGLPEAVVPQSAATFGMELIADLVDQLHGRLQVSRDGGTTFRILFPKSKASSAPGEDHK